MAAPVLHRARQRPRFREIVYFHLHPLTINAQGWHSLWQEKMCFETVNVFSLRSWITMFLHGQKSDGPLWSFLHTFPSQTGHPYSSEWLRGLLPSSLGAHLTTLWGHPSQNHSKRAILWGYLIELALNTWSSLQKILCQKVCTAWYCRSAMQRRYKSVHV